MRRRRHLRLLSCYEVTGQPVVGPTRLSYVPWVQQAVSGYSVTQLPQCTVVGLWDALRQAEVQAS